MLILDFLTPILTNEALTLFYIDCIFIKKVIYIRNITFYILFFKKTVKNAFQKSDCPFFKKKQRSNKSGTRSKMERSRTRSSFSGMFSFLKKKPFDFFGTVVIT